MRTSILVLGALALSSAALVSAQTAPAPMKLVQTAPMQPGQPAPMNAPAMQPGMNDTMNMTPNRGRTYVLVHGALLGKWSWDRVAPALQRAGNTVITLDLPGHGDDKTPQDKVSLANYRDAVIAAIGNRTNVILVGHSFGGVVISEVAEAIPQKIGKLVYLGALFPQNGESASALAGSDKGSLFGKYVMPSGAVLNFAKEGVRSVFCNDCSAADLALVQSRPRSEPAAPFGTPVKLSAAFAGVPKAVILTGNDHAVSLGLQVRTAARAGVNEIYFIDSGHLPFSTQPLKLTNILLNIR
ncbi:alpha/beta fold hydrolase [Deinococcus altitudinis]|uniref:alpha/beta fold hydrolase n=1 Tax=Deinococcus altitudinis TaxID=468914 RepID=UPI003892BD60